MAYSYSEVAATGGNTFNIPFDYIEQGEISVFVDGVSTSFTFTSSNVIDITPAPTTGATVRIERNTNLTNRTVDFASGAVLTEEDLDNSNIQVFHAAQEAIDKADAAISLDADGKFNAEVGGTERVIKNVADPSNPQDVTTKNWVENTWLSPSDKAQLNAIDTTKLHTVANDIANVNTTAGSIANVNTVGGAIANVNTTAGSITNVNTTATNIADVNTVATNIADINTVENSIANVNTTATNIADVNTVATNIGDINTVENSIANVNKVGTDIANVNTTAGSIANVNTVATNVADVNTTAGAIANVNAVGTNIANVNAVAGNATNINAVKANETNINAVNANSGNINTVAGNNTNVTTVATNIANVNTVATDMAKVNQVATDIVEVKKVADDLLETVSEIETVAASIANVDAVGTNISNVNTVASNLTSVNSFHDTYTIAATAPTTGLSEGDLWFDTTGDKMMVYNGGSWQNAGSSVNGTAARFKFTATASQTAFSGADANSNTLAYDAGYIDVYLNGVHLDPSDYTATDGSTITLAAGATAGDELYVVAFGTFTLATHYTKTETDALLAGISSDALIDSGGTTRVQATTSGANVTGALNATNITTGKIQNSKPSDYWQDSDYYDINGYGSIGTQGAYEVEITCNGYRNLSGTWTGVNTNSMSGASGVSLNPSGKITFRTEANKADGSSPDITPRMVIESDGNVGIGLTSPSLPLQVKSTGNSPLVNAIGLSPSTNDNVQGGIGVAAGGIISVSGVNSLRFNTTNTERMRIDGSGYVTTPNVPAFRARMLTASGINATPGGTNPYQLLFNNTAYEYDNGNNFNPSTGRFTAPVAGHYFFSANMRVDGVGSGYVYFDMEHNGTTICRDLQSINTSYNAHSLTGVTYMGAGDWVGIVVRSASDTSITVDSDSWFTGHLIG